MVTEHRTTLLKVGAYRWPEESDSEIKQLGELHPTASDLVLCVLDQVAKVAEKFYVSVLKCYVYLADSSSFPASVPSTSEHHQGKASTEGPTEAFSFFYKETSNPRKTKISKLMQVGLL